MAKLPDTALNPVLTFVRLCCYEEPGLSERVEDLWEAWSEWREAVDCITLRKRFFVPRLRDKLRVSKGRALGVALKPDEDWDLVSVEDMRKVYVISNGRSLKIGVGQDPLSRLKALQTGSDSPLRILYVLWGGYELEGALHSLLGAYRMSGEWFEDCDAVRELLGGYSESLRAA